MVGVKDGAKAQPETKTVTVMMKYFNALKSNLLRYYNIMPNI